MAMSHEGKEKNVELTTQIKILCHEKEEEEEEERMMSEALI